jgi:hypothetical protein
MSTLPYDSPAQAWLQAAARALDWFALNDAIGEMGYHLTHYALELAAGPL